MAAQYNVCGGVLLRINNPVYIDGELCLIPPAVSFKKTDYERFIGARDVPWVYEYDRGIFHSQSNGTDQFAFCVDTRVFGERGIVVLYM